MQIVYLMSLVYSQLAEVVVIFGGDKRVSASGLYRRKASRYEFVKQGLRRLIGNCLVMARVGKQSDRE